MDKQYVGFYIGNIRYCIDIMDVQEVYREEQITHMPDVPPFVEGIINLRSVVVPIISIKKKLGLTDNEEEKGSLQKILKTVKLIIVHVEGVLVGFLVDSLDRVFSIEETGVQSADGVTSTVDKNMVEGVAKIGDSVYIILDAKKILDLSEKQFIKEEIIE